MQERSTQNEGKKKDREGERMTYIEQLVSEEWDGLHKRKEKSRIGGSH